MKAEIEKIARDLRAACIEQGVVHTPDHPVWPWHELPEDRKARWMAVASTFYFVFRVMQ